VRGGGFWISAPRTGLLSTTPRLLAESPPPQAASSDAAAMVVNRYVVFMFVYLRVKKNRTIVLFAATDVSNVVVIYMPGFY
jgi:hypothetical protein